MTYDTTRNSIFLTLGEAASQAGLSKSTVSRAIRDGKLSATRSVETNSFKIDPAELHRYKDAVQVVRNTVAKQDGEQLASPVLVEKGGDDAGEAVFATRLKEAVERAELEARVKLAEARLSDIKAMVEDLRSERDEWRTVAHRSMVTHQPARRGLFGWLTRKAG